jgi:hypothetical protein
MMRRQKSLALTYIFQHSGESMSKRIVALCVMLAAILCCGGLALTDIRAAAWPDDSPGYWGFDTANLDKTCKPCDDFFQFAMGGWMKSSPIPPEYSTWGSFRVLIDKNQQALRHILDVAAKSSAPAGSNERKIGDFYASCMDTTAIEAAGSNPIETRALQHRAHQQCCGVADGSGSFAGERRRCHVSLPLAAGRD